MKQDSFHSLKIIKMVQLGISILFFILFFLLLYLTPSLRANIYTNKNLYLLCALLWLFMIYSFISLIIDFSKMKEHITGEHELKRSTYLDHLTGIPNRYSCDLIFDTYKDASDIDEIGCILFSISNLTEINEKDGREAGDQALQDFSELLSKVADSYGFVGRNGGNEFLAVLENCTEGTANQLIHDAEQEIKARGLKIAVVSVYVLNHYEQMKHFTDLVAVLYKKLLK